MEVIHILKFAHNQSQHNGSKILDQGYVNLVEFHSTILHWKIDHIRNRLFYL